MKFFDELIDLKIEKNMGICNMTDEFFCFLINYINRTNNKNILIVVNSLFEANKLYNSLSLYNRNVYLFPMDDFLTSEALAMSFDLMANRMETLNKTFTSDGKVIITNLMGYLRFLPSKKTYESFIYDLKVGDIISPKSLSEKLIMAGYSRTTVVSKTGEFALRGFVIDAFFVDDDNPTRIEFFDDEIESIRQFDVETQKSISNISTTTIKPFFEFLTTKNVLEEHFGKQKYLQLYENVENIGDYLDNHLTVFKDYDQLCISYRNILNETIDYRAEKDLSFKNDYFFDFNSRREEYPIYYSSLNNLNSNEYVNKFYSFDVKTINNFNED